jgi:hypothetical protein
MIIEFSTKNFRSFRELATLSLEAESLKTGKNGLSTTIKDEPWLSNAKEMGVVHS